MADQTETALVHELAHLYSIEHEGLRLLGDAIELTDDDALAAIYLAHLRETQEHMREIAARLAAHGEPNPSARATDKAQTLGLRWPSPLDRGTPAALAVAAYAFENLEIAAYHLLRGIAERALDEDTVAVSERILEQEEAAAERLASTFDRVLELSLDQPRLLR